MIEDGGSLPAANATAEMGPRADLMDYVTILKKHFITEHNILINYTMHWRESRSMVERLRIVKCK